MKKLPIFIMNILVVIISAVAIFMYFYSPFFKVSVSYTVHASDFEDAMNVEGMDLSGTLDDVNIDLSIAVELDPVPLAEMLFKQDAEATVEKLVSSNVSKLIDTLSNSLNSVVDAVIKSVVKSTIKSELKSQVKEHLLSNNGEMSDNEIDELFERAGFTDDYIDSQTERILNELLSDTATVDSITTTTVNVAKDVFDDLKESGEPEFADLEFSEENQQIVEDAVSSTLDLISEEDGSVNTDLYINTLMLQLVKSMNSDSEGGDTETISPDIFGKANGASPLSNVVPLDGEESTPSDADEVLNELKTEVSKLIMGLIPDGFNQYLTLVFNILAGLLLFSAFTWAYLILKIFFKLFAKNPAIKLGLPIWLGWLPFLFFWVAPFCVLKFAPLPDLVSTMNISFFTSGIYAFCAAIALIIIWIPYGRMRKRRKKALKQKKVVVEVSETANTTNRAATVETTQASNPASTPVNNVKITEVAVVYDDYEEDD